MAFFPELVPGRPWYSLFVTEFFMRVYDLPFNVENQVRALAHLQRTYDLDLSFPRMDLDEFGGLFRGSAFSAGSSPVTRGEVSERDPASIVRAPKGGEVAASPSFRVLKRLASRGPGSPEFKHLGAYIPGPYSLFSSVVGIQVASELCILERKFVREVMAEAARAVGIYAEKLSVIVDVFLVLAPSECTISRRAYTTTVAASMIELVRHVAKNLGVPTALHFCSSDNSQVVNRETILPLVGAGLGALNVPNIAEHLGLASDLGVALWGGIDPIEVQRKPREVVLRELRGLLDVTSDSGFVLGTNCQVHQIPKVICSGALLDKLMAIKKLVT
ncbi:MAG: hypothetical protein ACTSU5_04600 [Promethearchaeota archaeon]